MLGTIASIRSAAEGAGADVVTLLEYTPEVRVWVVVRNDITDEIRAAIDRARAAGVLVEAVREQETAVILTDLGLRARTDGYHRGYADGLADGARDAAPWYRRVWRHVLEVWAAR